MTARSGEHHTHGVPRRSVTRTAAWSVPAVTTVIAAPTLAASSQETVDLVLVPKSFGSAYTGYSPDRYQAWRMSIVGGYLVTNEGTAPVTGAVVTVSYDSRAFSATDLTVEEQAASSTGTTTDGNVITDTYVLPVIPAGGTVSLGMGLTETDPPGWGPDMAPYTVTISPPLGLEDATPGNNTETVEVEYNETNDPTVTATWLQRDLVLASGDVLPVYVQDTVTITANSPGDVPSGSYVTIDGPSVYDNAANDFAPVYEDVILTSAVLDGQDVSGQLEKQPASEYDDTRDWVTGFVIPAGQQLVMTVDVVLLSPVTGDQWVGPASAGIFANWDRDMENNNARAETIP